MNAVVRKEVPSQHERMIARQSARTLTALMSNSLEEVEFDLSAKSGDKTHVTLPVSALKLLAEILAEIGNGNMITITPIHAELTTQEAAQILNVSRPFLVSLLENGNIPFTKVGTHRRVKYQDLMDYKQGNEAERNAALDDLAKLSQELEMGY
ncbi:MAG: helix-turn-helix domain-containing protein [Methyloprofundus sp.]|nr:helix-turn-helix domain-containing protein [Methyloprofundus sp.]